MDSVLIILCSVVLLGSPDASLAAVAWGYGAVHLQEQACYGSIRPVLKHGPRSLTCARVLWWKTIKHREIKRRDPLLAHLRLHLIFCEKSSKSV